MLTATIAKAEADVQIITKYVAGLDADVTQWTADLEKAREERAKEHKLFEEAHAEYVDSIDAVARAIKMLKTGPGQSFTQVSKSVFSLLQVQDGSINKKQLKKFMSFIQKYDPAKALLQEAEDEGVAPPEVAAYESSSGGVIEMVEKLGDKFDDERIELEKREANANNAFLQMSADLEGQIKTAGMERGMKESTKAERLSDAARRASIERGMK